MGYETMADHDLVAFRGLLERLLVDGSTNTAEDKRKWQIEWDEWSKEMRRRGMKIDEI